MPQLLPALSCPMLPWHANRRRRQVVEACIATRALNGGMLELGALRQYVSVRAPARPLRVWGIQCVASLLDGGVVILAGMLCPRSRPRSVSHERRRCPALCSRPEAPPGLKEPSSSCSCQEQPHGAPALPTHSRPATRVVHVRSAGAARALTP